MWQSIENYAMPEGMFYNTKIYDEENGARCVQELKRIGNLYYCRDGSYVCYKPTHYWISYK